MAWGNPILGSNGALVVPVVKSPNFVSAQPYGANLTGVGWYLGKTGTVEFGSMYANSIALSGNGINLWPAQFGVESITFGAATSFSKVVNFTQSFVSAPFVVPNINVAPASTGNWAVRAISIGAGGFTIFCSGPSAAWSNVAVGWIAIGN